MEKFDPVGGGFTGFVLRGSGKKSSTVGDMKCLISELGKPMIPKKKHNFWYYLHPETEVCNCSGHRAINQNVWAFVKGILVSMVDLGKRRKPQSFLCAFQVR